jgi:hypothetical protein
MKGDRLYKVTIEGVRPLLMHNGRLANPMDPMAKALKAITSRKGKSDDDHADMARAEFEGGMYYDKKLGPYIPTDNLQAAIVQGAKVNKKGQEFLAFIDVVAPDDADGYALQYTGPRTVDGLWNNPEFVFTKGVKIGKVTVQRTRPRFKKWSLTFEVEVVEGGPAAEDVERAITMAGARKGLGDWKPRYGRFAVKSFKAA